MEAVRQAWLASAEPEQVASEAMVSRVPAQLQEPKLQVPQVAAT